MKWRQMLSQLPDCVAPVAVIYADWQACNAPEPEAVLEAARDAPCSALLIDTVDKHGPDLFGCLGVDRLQQLIRSADAAGMLSVVGGRLLGPAVTAAARLRPGLVAVRTAACEGGREGRVCTRLVADLAAAVRQCSSDRAGDSTAD